MCWLQAPAELRGLPSLPHALLALCLQQVSAESCRISLPTWQICRPHAADTRWQACLQLPVRLQPLLAQSQTPLPVCSATCCLQVRGYGLSGDGHHITQPSPEGCGARLAMQRALVHSGQPAEAVAYLNAHATSTPQGDAVEQAAIAHVFPHAGAPSRHPVQGHPCQPLQASATSSPSSELLAVSSTKGATGHLLGAAGAVEAIFTVLALANSIAPHTANLEQPDPALLGNLVQGRPQQLSLGPKMAMTNSFGFGGTNASLLFATPPIVYEELVDGTP